MAVQTIPACGCTINDLYYDTTHHPATDVASTGSPGDAARGCEGHWPLLTSPGSYCKTCDLYRPCLCPGERLSG